MSSSRGGSARFRALSPAFIVILVLCIAAGCAASSTDTTAVAGGSGEPTVPAAPPTSPSPTPSPTYAPPEPTTSPSGLSLEVGPVEAALGHRASVVTLTNDGEHAVTVDGYPEIRVLDAAGDSLDVVTEHDSSYMAIDPGPAPVSVAPGEELLSVVSWAATVTDPDAVERAPTSS